MGLGCNASVVVGYLINNASIGTVDLYLTRDQELVNARDPCRLFYSNRDCFCV
jgi:hypothetical protein